MAQPSLRPWKIGVLVDIPDTPGMTREFVDIIQLALDLAHESGRLDRPVELVSRIVTASPWASTHELREAHRELTGEGVLAIAGPMTTDNSLALLPEIEAARVPTISICGTSSFAGAYAFSIPNGGLAEEPLMIGSFLAAQGVRTVALLREEPSRIADEYASYLRQAAGDHSLSILATEGLSAVAGDIEVAGALTRLSQTDADALVYLGFGSLFRSLTPGLADLEWDPVKMTNTVFVGAQCNTRFAQLLEGWYGIEQYDERNTVFARALRAWEDRGGSPAANSVATCGYDIGRCLAVALERMTYPAPTALRDALETIRRLPAATGAPGTYITFGYRDHRGLKGPGYLVIRRAEGGATHWVGTAPVGNEPSDEPGTGDAP